MCLIILTLSLSLLPFLSLPSPLSPSLPPLSLQTFYESKSKATLAVPAYSEAGDSGVGGMTDISQAQSVATSQEDLHLITGSPLSSMTDLKNPFSSAASRTSPSPQLLSDNESSHTVVEDDESSTPRSNSSLMAVSAS